MVQFGLIVLNSTGGIAMLARVALVVVILCFLATPLVNRARNLHAKPEPNGSVDLDELWQRYRRGDISWDEYLRGKVEGARGLVGTKAEAPGIAAPEGFAADDTASS